MENNSSEYPKTYHGPLFDVVINDSSKDDPERIQQLIDPENQRKRAEEAEKWFWEQYGETMRQLKDL